MDRFGLMVIGVLVAGLMGLSGCLESTGVAPAVGMGEANTVFTLTDAPADEYEAVNLSIEEMKLYRDDGVESIPVDMETNLKNLEDVSMVLAEAEVPEDQYNKITMKLERVRTRTQNGEVRELDLPREEITVAEDALLEEGDNSVDIDIPVESAVENDSFAPKIQTRVRGNVSFTTPEGTQVQVRAGESVEVQGGHGNANVSIDVGEQGGQQVQVQRSEQAQERAQKMMEKKSQAQENADGRGSAGDGASGGKPFGGGF